MSYSFTVTRTFDAPRELVYDAWVTPEHFSQWFGTDAVAVPLETLSMDVREGGAWNAIMHLPDGNTIDWTGEFVTLDRPVGLALTMTDRPAEPARALVTVALTEIDGGTEMVMTQSGDVDGFGEEQIAATIAGYNGFFDVMERLVTAAA
jgi:uncharacterized protein YndB with AHSA1/START domain